MRFPIRPQGAHLWKQILAFILLTTIAGSLGIYIYAQRQYTLLREEERQQHWNVLQTLKRQVVKIWSQTMTSDVLTSVDADRLQQYIQHLFEQSPHLFRVSLIEQHGTFVFAMESQEMSIHLQNSPFSFPYDDLQLVQCPLAFTQSSAGQLRAEFWPTDTGARLIKLTKNTLQIILISVTVMIIMGGGLIFSQITSRLSSNQKRLEEYVVSLEKANENLRRARKELQISEKLASLGYLAAGIAHEIGNPVGAVLGYIELLQKNPMPHAKTQDILERTGQEIERIRRILQELVHFSRPHSINIQTVDINKLIHKVIAHFPQHSEKHIDREITLTEFPLWADIDEQKLQSVVYNLLCNAVDAISTSGSIQIATSRRIKETSNIVGSSEVIAIQISDTGSGIPEEELTKIFEPFYTTKDPGKGMGLGLSLCHRIVESLNGELEIRSVCGRGTDVIVFLPPARKESIKRRDKKERVS